MMNKKVNRRRYLKYVGASVVIAAASTIGYYEYRRSRHTPASSTTSTLMSTLPISSPTSISSQTSTQDLKGEGLEDAPVTAVVAKKLEIPWALDFLPDGSIIFTERIGRIRLIDVKEGLLSKPLVTIDEAAHVGEGGLLGITVHPEFALNQYVYAYYTYHEAGKLANRVVRFQKRDHTLNDKKIVINNIPGAAIHDGGRIKFGPDGLLYITTGDASDSNLAQNKNSLAGKILRLHDDGTIPDDNPFPNSPIYSLGHRNPQGLAWDDQGRLWATEHGSTKTDELNLIEPAKNYGWPIIRGDEKAAGLEIPVIHSGTETWAPSGAAYLDSSLFFAGLRGQTLFEVTLEDHPVNLHSHFDKKFGRLRDVIVGPDHFLYLLTSNRDGRGVPTSDDDKIIRINPWKL